MGFKLFAVALLAAACSGAAQAKEAVPANTIECTYRTLSGDDREIALLLLFIRHEGDEKQGMTRVRGALVVDRMLSAARERCRATYRWTKAQAELSYQHAGDALLAEALAQSIESDGKHRVSPIIAYFERNRANLKADRQMAGTAFASYLANRGWIGASEEDLTAARNYLAILVRQADQRRLFQSSRVNQTALPAKSRSRAKP